MRTSAALLTLVVADATDVAARSRDFIDETLVSYPFKVRALGIELGLESRLDADYRVQGWYSTELETGLTRWCFIEAVALLATRGQGLELGGWRAGARLRLPNAARFPIDATATVEYEVETDVWKHPLTERILVPRLALTHVWRDWMMTGNLGAASRLSPSPVTRFAWGAGLRYPYGRDLQGGIEIAHEPLEDATRITPQLRIQFPGETKLRLGTVFGLDPHPYWFTARAILETEF